MNYDESKLDVASNKNLIAPAQIEWESGFRSLAAMSESSQAVMHLRDGKIQVAGSQGQDAMPSFFRSFLPVSSCFLLLASVPSASLSKLEPSMCFSNQVVATVLLAIDRRQDRFLQLELGRCQLFPICDIDK